MAAAQNPPPARKVRLPRVELIQQLSHTLGEEKATEVVNQAAAQLGLGFSDYDRDEVIVMLDKLAATPGLVGVVARFAKARVALYFSGK